MLISTLKRTRFRRTIDEEFLNELVKKKFRYEFYRNENKLFVDSSGPIDWY